MSDHDLVEDPEAGGEPENPPAPLIELYEVIEWETATGDEM